ncbi:flagella basal body P-ring formation protein FlgA [Sulfitobacter undariae]|uniref:Flagella basal body P-ring formation protein FlgA n=1 Tax=Sulfitobacter undariae TaxID=1563671 RepID=A0A7W6E9K5_9RHOB|nr:flagellar basal body P-ring formation chaperone FlgA [Sulfitobacter undariae]MBB3994228.1 flagella basal body P-ring formation protein FlgA [Sulfitobacter undariae]
MKLIATILTFMLVQPVLAETVVPVRTIRPAQTITNEDVTIATGKSNKGYANLSQVLGQEARVVLYAGRPIFLTDLAPPSVISRNQIVLLLYDTNGISISTEGRALERGAIGDRVRVMNLGSRATLFGVIADNGTIKVSN